MKPLYLLRTFLLITVFVVPGGCYKDNKYPNRNGAPDSISSKLKAILTDEVVVELGKKKFPNNLLTALCDIREGKAGLDTKLTEYGEIIRDDEDKRTWKFFFVPHYLVSFLTGKHGELALKLIRAFLESGFDPNTLCRGDEMENLLSLALEVDYPRYYQEGGDGNNIKLMKLLLAQKSIDVHVNIGGYESRDDTVMCRAFLCAIWKRNYSLGAVNLLLEAGADPHPTGGFESRKSCLEMCIRSIDGWEWTTHMNVDKRKWSPKNSGAMAMALAVIEHPGTAIESHLLTEAQPYPSLVKALLKRAKDPNDKTCFEDEHLTQVRNFYGTCEERYLRDTLHTIRPLSEEEQKEVLESIAEVIEVQKKKTAE